MQGARAPSDTADIFDLSRPKSNWTSVEQPFRRRAPAAFALGGKVHVVGVRTKGSIPRVDIYDPVSKEWTQGVDLVGGNGVGFSPAACVAGGQAYVSLNDGKVYRLDPAAKRWEHLATQRVVRFVHRLIPGEKDKLIVVGGAAHEGNARIVEEVMIPAKETAAR